MLNPSWPRTLLILLTAATVLTTTACGQGGKGNKNNNPAPDNPFAGKVMAVKKNVLVIHRDPASVEEAVLNGVPLESMVNFMHTYTYDSLGRQTREIIKAFPQNEGSNLPPTGGTAFDLQVTYRTDVIWEQDVSTMEQWDNWWDGASGARTSTTVWTDDQEEVTVYRNTGEIDRVELYENVDETNEHGYLIGSTKTQITGPSPGSTLETVYHRALDGKTLTGIESPNEVIDYEYNSNGAMVAMDAAYLYRNAREVHSLDYVKEDGRFLILIQSDDYDLQSGEYRGSRTIIEIFEQGFCHEANRRKDVFQRPNWEVCKELGEWD